MTSNKTFEQMTSRRPSFGRVSDLLTRLVAIGASLSLSGCDVIPQRYRALITVQVQTPHGLRSGHGVVEILAGKALALLPQEGKAQVELRGEAVAVDLPDGQTIYALLRTANGEQSLESVITAALEPGFRGGAEDFLQAVPKLGRSEMVGRSAALPPESYPLLVRFRNFKDSTSVEEVDPNDLSSSSQGMKLRGASVEVTGEPLSTGIKARLPWLGTTVTNYLSGRKVGGGPSLSDKLDTTLFKRGP